MPSTRVELTVSQLLACVRRPELLVQRLELDGHACRLTRRFRARVGALDPIDGVSDTPIALCEYSPDTLQIPAGARKWLTPRDALLSVPLRALDLSRRGPRCSAPKLRRGLLGVLVDSFYHHLGSLLTHTSLASLCGTSRSRIQDLLRKNSKLATYHVYYCPDRKRLSSSGNRSIATALEPAGCRPVIPELVRRLSTALETFEKHGDEAGHPVVYGVQRTQYLGIQLGNRYGFIRKKHRASLLEHAPGWKPRNQRIHRLEDPDTGYQHIYLRRSGKAVERDNFTFRLQQTERLVRLHFHRVPRTTAGCEARAKNARITGGLTSTSPVAPYAALQRFRRAAKQLAKDFGLGTRNKKKRRFRANALVNYLADTLEPGHLRELSALVRAVAGPEVLVEIFEGWIDGRFEVSTKLPGRRARYRTAALFLQAWNVVSEVARVDTPARARFLADVQKNERFLTLSGQNKVPFWIGPAIAKQSIRGRYFSIAHEAVQHLQLELDWMPRCPVYRSGAPPPWYSLPGREASNSPTSS